MGQREMREKREEEFRPELPMEGEATAAGDEAAATAVEASKKDSSVFLDERHLANFDRAALLAKIKGPSSRYTTSMSTGTAVGPREASGAEMEPEINEDLSKEQTSTAAPVKLGKRAILPSDEPVKRSKTEAAMAIAEANEPSGFEEMRAAEDVAASEAATGATGATGAPEPKEPKKHMIRPKPKAASSSSSSSVSAASASVKAVVKKIAEREDSTVNIAAYKIGDTVVATRLPPQRPLPQVQASEFYMNNRAKFIQYINALFRPYREELTSGESDITCESLYGGDDSASVALLTHQKIVRDYLNIYSPYRGLLLFHGLGSGKTCSSIAIAEGLKTFKKIVVMTPASLRMNYIEEMKTKCGDLMYKKNQYWEFIESRGNPELTRILSQILMLEDDKFVRANGGAWMVNVTKPSNYETELTASQRVRVDRQIDEMISAKYEFINYNGLRAEKLKSMTNDYTHNPFDNTVVVIDEAHNFVSRIVNKLKRPTSMAYRLYHFLLSAQNAKVILLTGTPIINYPNEIAVLFNILRGNIDNWVFTISEGGAGAGAAAGTGAAAGGRLTLDTFKTIFGLTGAESGRGRGKGAAAAGVAAAKAGFAHGIGLSFDYMDYNTRTKKLMITRNPFGFVRDYDSVSSKYRGVIRRGDPSAKMSDSGAGTAAAGAEESVAVIDTTSTENGLLSDAAFERAIIQKLRENGISVISASTNKQAPFTALPDKLDEFNGYFIDPSTLEFKNRDLFIRRILGLTSYFRSAQEKLLPMYDAATNFHVVEVEMSDYQFAIYSRVRDLERNQESNMKKKAKKRGAAAGAAGKSGSGSGGEGGEGIYDDVSSTYRIFSRAFCNFVFPPSIRRPLPGDDSTSASEIEKSAALGRLPDSGVVGDAHETAEMLAARIARTMDPAAAGAKGPAKRGRKPKGAAGAHDKDAGAAAALMDENMLDGIVEGGGDDDEDDSEMVITGEHSDAVAAVMAGTTKKSASTSKTDYKAQYDAAIAKAMRDLKVSAGSFLIPEELATYSPKFLHLLHNILDKSHIGLHLVYSQFRTLEGIGIIKLILEANGFSQFKIKQSSMGDWTIDMTPEEQERPCFALYTGTETAEEKEIIRNIFNSKWKNVPKTITAQLSTRFTNNMYGEVIKILMITASGAEGINLRNVRYVHITEPYWHPVRTEQIIGRARRICSHVDLPEELRTVDVFLYLMRFTARQIATDNDESLNIRMHDKSKTDGTTPMSTDQSLYEISNIKERITRQILTAVKESSFDCMIHANAAAKERLQCYSFGAGVGEETPAYQPNIATEEDDKTKKLNKQTKTMTLRKLVVNGKEYAEDANTHIIYDMELYKMGNLVERGRRTIIPADPRTGVGEQSRVDFI